MGEIIKFPLRRASSTTASGLRSNETSNTKPDPRCEKDSPRGPIFSAHEDEAFLELVQEWPCFQNLPGSMTLHEDRKSVV